MMTVLALLVFAFQLRVRARFCLATNASEADTRLTIVLWCQAAWRYLTMRRLYRGQQKKRGILEERWLSRIGSGRAPAKPLIKTKSKGKLRKRGNKVKTMKSKRQEKDTEPEPEPIPEPEPEPKRESESEPEPAPQPEPEPQPQAEPEPDVDDGSELERQHELQHEIEDAEQQGAYDSKDEGSDWDSEAESSVVSDRNSPHIEFPDSPDADADDDFASLIDSDDVEDNLSDDADDTSEATDQAAFASPTETPAKASRLSRRMTLGEVWVNFTLCGYENRTLTLRPLCVLGGHGRERTIRRQST